MFVTEDSLLLGLEEGVVFALVKVEDVSVLDGPKRRQAPASTRFSQGLQVSCALR